MTPRRCPLCYQPVEKTRHGNISGHMNSTRTRPCEASYNLPYECAYTTTPPKGK